MLKVQRPSNKAQIREIKFHTVSSAHGVSAIVRGGSFDAVGCGGADIRVPKIMECLLKTKAGTSVELLCQLYRRSGCRKLPMLSIRISREQRQPGAI